MAHPERIVIIGAGIGGLTTAAVLARAGLQVTVLEAHVYPGGCAGTFYHQGFRFEAGATLAGGFSPGGLMDQVASATGVRRWPVHHTSHAMRVRLPDGTTVDRFGDDRRWDARRDAFGPGSLPFWRWQERTADALWDLAMRSPAWPPQSPADVIGLARTGLGWLAADPAGRSTALVQDALRSVSHRLPDNEGLRLFVDGQLLIAAQATSEHANALYGAAALDLPRRGVVHLEGGIGAIATALADAVRASGGTILYRQEVSQIETRDGRPVGVRTKRGRRFPADTVIANLPPWNIARLFADSTPSPLRRLPPQPEQGWGAFTVYAGVDAGLVDAGMPLHHQLLVREPLGEGNSLFLSFSPSWDDTRAPSGHRALTISTHTDFRTWWRLFASDRAAYEQRKTAFADRVMQAAELAVPGLRDAARLVLPGTPVTFQRYTRRQWGWVGGFPQVSLFQAWGPRLAPGLWMVGDSIFPGQSTAAVALGGLRVAHQILGEGPETISRRLGRPAGSPGYQAGRSV